MVLSQEHTTHEATRHVVSAVIMCNEKSKGDDLRASRYAAFLARRDGAQLGRPKDDRAVARALALLSMAGQLAFDRAACPAMPDDIQVAYLASPAVAMAAQRESLPPWPTAALKKVARSVRKSPGALFLFPREIGGEPIEVFITDWSPCPAACALAVHRHHPAAHGVRSGFTGHYVRHPLTGDLLSVWVADWVKPSFGTGAVLVNPAHDCVDLEFGRQVGLPIRFALVLADHTGDPQTWPQAPIIKSGVSIRTGPYDGLDVEAARRRYFEVLEERGLARLHDDIRLPPAQVATLSSDPAGPLVYDDVTGRISVFDDNEAAPGARYAIRSVPALAALAPLAEAGIAKAVLVVSAAAQRDYIEVLPSLAADLGLTAAKGFTAVLMAPTEPTSAMVHDLAPLAVHVCAKIDQPAVVRQQSIDQIMRFVELHGQLIDRSMPSSTPMDAELVPARPIDVALASGDTAGAFKALSTWQKSLVADATASGEQLSAYRDRVWRLLGEVNS
jgi:leucyl-tRNA synthetase